MDFRQLSKDVKKSVVANAPVITTVTAVSGVVGTAIFAARGGIKAHEVLEDLKQEQEVDWKEAVKATWKFYIPTGICMSVSIASVILLHNEGARRLAASAALYALSEQSFAEYREAVVEKIGEEEESKVRKEITKQKLKDRAEEVNSIVIGGDEVLMLDSLSGRLFKSTVEDVRAAVNEINNEIIHNLYASLSEFYTLVGLDETAYSDDIGWNQDDLLQIDFEPAMAPNKRPCLEITYNVMPIDGFRSFR